MFLRHTEPPPSAPGAASAVTLIQALLLVALSVQALRAQQAPLAPFQEHANVTAIEVIADVRDESGKTPRRLRPSDFVLFEDGMERNIVSIHSLKERGAWAQPPVAAPAIPASISTTTEGLWQFVIYFDTQTTHVAARRRVARDLGRRAEALVEMGIVDVVLANPTPQPLVRASRDAAAVRGALKEVETAPEINQLYRNRLDLLAAIRNLGSLESVRAAYATRLPPPPEYGNTGSSSYLFPAPLPAREPQTVEPRFIRPYIDEELATINRFRENLTGWLGTYSRHSPRALIMVTSGFDLNPLEFYGALIGSGEQASLGLYGDPTGTAAKIRTLAETLAGAGWMTITLPGGAGYEGSHDANGSKRGRIIITKARSGPKAIMYRPLDPLLLTARETGGSVEVDSANFAQTIERLREHVLITYYSDRTQDGGRPRRIKVLPRDPKWNVTTAQWASSTPP